MADAWERIERWLGEHAPAVAAGLGPAATAESIAEAEAAIGVAFPEPMRRVYARHDGARSLMGEWSFLALQHVVRRWQNLKEGADAGDFSGLETEPDPRIAPGWWNPGWIPLAHNSSGDYHCVDTSPTPQGIAGQVIGYWHAEPRRDWLAADVDAWLNAFADDLEAGRYRVADGRLERS